MITRRQTITGLAVLAVAGTVTPGDAQIVSGLEEISAEQMLEAAVADIDARFFGKDGPPGPWSPTGEPYVTLVVGGIKPDGHKCPRWCEIDFDAVSGWLKSFNEYAEKRPHPSRLYWRERPIIDRIIRPDEPTLVTVYSRLVLTARPEMAEESKRSRRKPAAIVEEA